MKIECFEDLKCWQESRELTKGVYKLANSDSFRRDYRLRDQITGAAVSIMNNISEGFGSLSNREFIRFLRYARRSCSEVQNCVYVALDQEYIEQNEFVSLYEKAAQVRKIIDGLIRYLRDLK